MAIFVYATTRLCRIILRINNNITLLEYWSNIVYNIVSIGETNKAVNPDQQNQKVPKGINYISTSKAHRLHLFGRK